MSGFSLQPPKLLCVSNIEVYNRCFSLIKFKQSPTELVRLFNLSEWTPSISCHGPLVRIRRLAVAELNRYLESFSHFISLIDPVRIEIVLCLLHSDSSVHIDESSDCKTLPETVYRFVSPRDTLNFPVSFLLRFGHFHTELDLFFSSRLIASLIYANLLNREIAYHESHLNDLVKVYLLYDLRFQPGGILSFSSK